MARLWPASIAIILLTGCIEAPDAEPDEGAGPLPEGPRTLSFEGAEAPSEWYARTFSYHGIENRPGVGEWHLSTMHSRSGDRSWTFQDESANRYHDAATYDLHGGIIDLAGTTHPMLRFYYRGESEESSGDDFAWGLLVGGDIEAFGSTDLPAHDWTEVQIDLSRYAGTRIEPMFRFQADECGADTPLEPLCGEGTYEGYFVDDIEVYDVA